MTVEAQIQIDAKTRAFRSNNRWAIQRRKPDGDYDLVDSWDGNRRSLYAWLERNKISPTRQAERQLALLPEQTGFRER